MGDKVTISVYDSAASFKSENLGIKLRGLETALVDDTPQIRELAKNNIIKIMPTVEEEKAPIEEAKGLPEEKKDVAIPKVEKSNVK